ncbi:HCaRG protein (macronuclear) [Tetrahymena thermophila SB210]|uniref:HCaRG protein n=1 Tax=Tetrahymena thermophila (strain SB210) TaxID=312017 RepID=Q236D6_TETTS|nr:HCaRG protein [Tetrahymena thermophila SB210]EAR92564.3 HCaRG protein [Tetrahymena thermophila SB210]|eukprot:XP_001012809.3 HCaRG protein [Tetrahymena thermophila SB210]
MIVNSQFLEELQVVEALDFDGFEKSLNYTISYIAKSDTTTRLNEILEIEEESANQIFPVLLKLVSFFAKFNAGEREFKAHLEMIQLNKDKKLLFLQKMKESEKHLRKALGLLERDNEPEYANLRWRFDLQVRIIIKFMIRKPFKIKQFQFQQIQRFLQGQMKVRLNQKYQCSLICQIMEKQKGTFQKLIQLIQNIQQKNSLKLQNYTIHWHKRRFKRNSYEKQYKQINQYNTLIILSIKQNIRNMYKFCKQLKSIFDLLKKSIRFLLIYNLKQFINNSFFNIFEQILVLNQLNNQFQFIFKANQNKLINYLK